MLESDSLARKQHELHLADASLKIGRRKAFYLRRLALNSFQSVCKHRHLRRGRVEISHFFSIKENVEIFRKFFRAREQTIQNAEIAQLRHGARSPIVEQIYRRQRALERTRIQMHSRLARDKERTENNIPRFFEQIIVGTLELQRGRLPGVNPYPTIFCRVELNAAELVENPQQLLFVEDVVMKPDRLHQLASRGRQDVLRRF